MDNKVNIETAQGTEVVDTIDEAQYVAILRAMTDRHGILHVSADTLIPTLVKGQRAIALVGITERFIESIENCAREKNNWEEFMNAMKSFIKEIDAHNAKNGVYPAGSVN